MRIAISTLVTPPQMSGVGHYLQRLLEGLQTIDQDNEYLLLVSRETQDLFPVTAPNFSHVVLPFPHDPRWLMRPLYFFWQNFLFGSFARKNGVDILHIPNLVPVLAVPVPTVLTLHDLAEFHITRYHSRFRQWYRRELPKRIVRTVDRVITISNHSKTDLVDLCGADPDRVIVTYEAPGIPPQPNNNSREQVLARYGVNGRYILYVGKALIHKNLYFLIRTFARVKSVLDCADLKLVLAGGFGHAGGELKRIAGTLGLSDSVVFTGYVAEEDLSALYRGSLFFVFPSLYEGFGLPLLEAMQFGTPVLAANTSCLPEIGGNAALYADPRDEMEWERQMVALVRDAALRNTLRELGSARCRQFTWEKCARETLEVYREVASHGA